MTPHVVILGAGPAGCTAARLLCSWGHDVTVLSRRPGHDRTLAESLPPTSVALLERVGFAGLGAAGFMRYTGNVAWWGTGEHRVEAFADGRVGYQVERAALDALLAREAAGAGADVRLGANVTSVERGDMARVAFEHDGRSESIAAAWVLDCTGRVGVVARNGWRQTEHAARTMALVGVWESNAWPAKSDPSHTIVESTPDGWAWCVPVSDTRRYVTLMVDPAITQVAGRAALDEAYAAQLERTRLGEIVRHARRAAPVFARDASPYSARSYGEQGTLLVGDAGSFVDPLSSFGVKKAVASAWLASVVVHSILLNESIAGPALELFTARERSMYDALQRAAASLARDAATAFAGAGDFWESRATLSASDPETAAEPDAASLRNDPDVLRSFEALRSRDAIRLRASSLVRRTHRPTVRGNRVVVEEHLVVPAFPEGVRYIRNVDLLRLSELAVAHEQVPDLFDAYNRVAPPVPLPDFLGALSVLIGKGVLRWDERHLGPSPNADHRG